MIDLRRGDCLELMKDIPDNIIDAIITDPPYGTTACKWDTVIDFDLMWKELKRIRKDCTPIILFGSEPFSSALRMSNIKEFKYDWIWEKNKPTGMLNAKKQPMRNTENISVFYKKQPYFNSIKEKRTDVTNRLKTQLKTKDFGSNIYSKKNGTDKKIVCKKRYATQLKYFNVPTKRYHHTQKPVELLEYLLKTYTNENDLVLDFTMGSGTTGVACKNLNRNFIGIEKEEKYFEIAKKRIEESTQNNN